MTEKRFKMSVARTKATGIILEKELNTDEVYDELMRLDKENKELKQENKQLKQRCKELHNNLINYSALIDMLEKVKALSIEDMIWNTMRYKTQAEFDDDFADYRRDVKKRWRE